MDNLANIARQNIATSTLIMPNNDCDQVQAWLVRQPRSDTILITHQPLVSALIGYFCYGDRHAGQPMMPASVSVLTGDTFVKGCMRLSSLQHAQ